MKKIRLYAVHNFLFVHLSIFIFIFFPFISTSWFCLLLFPELKKKKKRKKRKWMFFCWYCLLFIYFFCDIFSLLIKIKNESQLVNVAEKWPDQCPTQIRASQVDNHESDDDVGVRGGNGPVHLGWFVTFFFYTFYSYTFAFGLFLLSPEWDDWKK